MEPSLYTIPNPNPLEREMTETDIQVLLSVYRDFKSLDTLIGDLQTQHGSIEPVRQRVIALAEEYHLSKPGRPTWSNNTALEGQIFYSQEDQEVTWSMLSEVFGTLEYRLSCTKVATLLLSLCKIPLPDDKTCSDWDLITHTMERSKFQGNEKEKWYRISSLVAAAQIFPVIRARAQGLYFDKPARYVTRAIFDAFKQVGIEEIEKRV
jgi:hypothetical protein